MIELEEARHALDSVRQELSVGDAQGGNLALSILGMLRKQFPDHWKFPMLDFTMFEIGAFNTVTHWDALTREVELAVNAQIVEVLRAKAAEAITNKANASKKGRRSKHSNKRPIVEDMVDKHAKSHDAKAPGAWARQIVDGLSSVTVNALATEASDKLTSAGFEVEEQPDLKTLRNWVRERLEQIISNSGISDR